MNIKLSTVYIMHPQKEGDSIISYNGAIFQMRVVDISVTFTNTELGFCFSHRFRRSRAHIASVSYSPRREFNPHRRR